MRRGGEDELLAISPPPEFQDNPSLPPPVLFRDLSPSTNPDHHRPRKNSIILSQAVQKRIKEFADKVSYNIVNEAMIIATLIPSSGVNDVRSQASTPSFPISSGDSYSSDTISTGTSWEYLEKSTSVADLRCLRNSFWSPPDDDNPGRRRYTGNNPCSQLKKSNSDALSYSDQQHSSSGMCSGSKSFFDSCHSRVKKVVVRKKSLKISSSKSSSKLSGDRFTSSSITTRNNSLPHQDSNSRPEDVDLCYNVPFQCDIYSLPVDSISREGLQGSSTRNNPHPKKSHRSHSKSVAKRHSLGSNEKCHQTKDLKENDGLSKRTQAKDTGHSQKKSNNNIVRNSRTRLASEASVDKNNSSGSRLSERNNNENVTGDKMRWSKKRRSRSVDIDNQNNSLNHRGLVQSTEAQSSQITEFSSSKRKRNFGHTLLNLFRRNRSKSKTVQLPSITDSKLSIEREIVLVSRALPSPPHSDSATSSMANKSPAEPRDFVASIDKVKDCGWYWGPLASEEAEDLLRGEPDGSFIVRDSSDAHYIFSLTFKLNGLVRHVRIEHDQGNFSFGPLTRFKAATIVEFVEKAVAHSRSGRYLFFLHRRPVLGPMQVQLLHPYSRFRHPRSLQHMCRFVILKFVRRDLLNTLPLPKPLQDYLNTPHNYYFEQQELSNKNTTTTPTTTT